MKIALITTLPKLIENERIKVEVGKLGHDFNLIDLENFDFQIINGKLEVGGLRDFNADLVIIRGIFSSIKAISLIIKSLRESGVKVFDNNFVKHRYSIDKLTDLIKLNLAGIKIPDMFYARDFSKFIGGAEKLNYPVIVKSTRMGKGAGVFKMDNRKELEALLDELINEGKEAKNYIMQEFIPYKYDLRCLIIGDKVFTMRRIPEEGEFRANFSLGGDVELFDLDERGKEFALKAIKAVDMDVAGVDVLIDKSDNRYILEVNHTAGFVGMEKASGENIGKIYVECAIERAK